MLEEYINEDDLQFQLIIENIRPAYLFNNINIINKYKIKYPSLIFTNFGNFIIASSQNLENYELNDSIKIGKLLGYPDAGNINEITKIDIHYVISIDVIFKTHPQINIFVNVAKNLNNLKKYIKIALKIKKYILTNNLYKNEFENVIVSNNVNYSDAFILNELKIQHYEYLKKYSYNFSNILYNLNFSENLCDYNFDLKNKIHKLLLILLISYSVNNPIEQFHPLTEIQNVNNICCMEELEISILILLNNDFENPLIEYTTEFNYNVKNCLYGLNFSYKLYSYKFDLNNIKHETILLLLMAYSKHNPIKFFLNLYEIEPYELETYKNKMREWEKDLLYALKN